MRLTIKLIVKFGLIAEIITAIIGLIGEYSLRYPAYQMAMDELFGVWSNSESSESMKKFHQHLDWPSNHQHYDHQTGESYKLSQLNELARVNHYHDDDDNFNDNPQQQQNRTFLSKFFSRISTWLFPHQSSSSSSNSNSIFTHSAKDSKLDRNFQNLQQQDYSFDPRPLFILSILIILNFIFIFSIIFELLTLIGLMSMSWILYLILLFVVVHVMNDNDNNSIIDQSSSSSMTKLLWTSILPSPFIILVVVIILLFTFILIALITEERRQFAQRIRARSACIPLVKSRDMDLDDI